MPNMLRLEIRIREFANEIQALIHEAITASVNDVLGGAAPTKRGPGRPRKSPPATKAPSTRSNGRRAAEDVANTVERVRDYIVANPGQGAEHIGPALRLTTKQLALPITKLLASKAITRKGVRRATRYFAGQ